MEERLAGAWEACCGDVTGVSVYRGSILAVQADAVISPANSFGFMDGGVDAAYMGFFGPDTQHRVQQIIRDLHQGELVIGTAEIVETGTACLPYLIAAPTMHVPIMLGASVNAYLAAQAALLLILWGQFRTGKRTGERIADHVHTVAFPDLEGVQECLSLVN